MSTTIKVRSALALFFSAVLTISFTACSPMGYGSDLNPKTSKYIFEQFKDGQYLDPFQTGSADIGATMEAMIQLSGVGYDQTKQTKAIDWLTANTELVRTPGQRGEFIFAAHALGFANDAAVAPVLKKLISEIPEDSVIPDTNNFSYSWVILGLAAAGENNLANKLALKLSTLSELDGGYKYIYNDFSSDAAADVTGFSIMAFKATEGFGNEQEEAAKTFAIGKAKAWLLSNMDSHDHWLGYGDYDVSGTAYAAMALGSIGEKTENYATWLKSQVNAKDGGLIAPWTDPDSDVFATAQSILAMSKLSFIDILKHSK